VGYAMPKTGLCHEGILALNTGLIDPGYEGRISTVAVNFDKEPVAIRPGDSFLRVVFHKLDGPAAASAVERAVRPTPEDYIAARLSDSERYPRTFMDVPGQTERLAKDVSSELLGNWTSRVVTLITILSFLFLLWNLAAYALLARQSASAVQELMQIDRGDERMRALEARLQSLESAAASRRPDTASRPRAGVQDPGRR
jgi:hypothetical protein